MTAQTRPPSLSAMSNRRNRAGAASIPFLLFLVGMWAAPLVPLGAAEQGPLSGFEPSDGERLDVPEPGMVGKEGPAPSSTPSKQDRADILSGEPPFSDAVLRAEVLKELYDQLRKAKDAAAAEPITEAIEETWRSSGSDTVDLLMSRVDAFVLQSDLDLALEVLDAVTDIAPDTAEGWHQRAIVHLMQNDTSQALSDLRRTLDIDPNHYKALRDLGAVLQQTGDKKGALDAYRKALEVNPFLEQARRQVDLLSLDVEGRDI